MAVAFFPVQQEQDGPNTSGSEAPRSYDRPPRLRWIANVVMAATAAALITAFGTLWALNDPTMIVTAPSRLVLGVPEHMEYADYPNTGCANWQSITGPRGINLSLDDCRAWCTAYKDADGSSTCEAVNYMPKPCPPPDGWLTYGTGCELLLGPCVQGPNTCQDLYVKEGFVPDVSNESGCALLGRETNMALIALPSYQGNAPFSSFSGTQQDAYECVSWTVTIVNGCVDPCVANGSLRAIYPVIVGSPACRLISDNLRTPTLIQANCSQFKDSDVDSVVQTLANEVSQVCSVGNWYTQLSMMYNQILVQQEEAFFEMQGLLDMKPSDYVPAPAPSPEKEQHHVVGWITGTLNLVSAALGFYPEYKVLANTLKLTSLVLGDLKSLTSSSSKADPNGDDYNPMVWEGMKFFQEQAAEAATLNAETVVLENVLQVINVMLLAVEEVFKTQSRLIVADAGKLAGASEVVMTCVTNTPEILATVAKTKQAQLWRALIFMMPMRYAVFLQRDMSNPTVPDWYEADHPKPPCFSDFADPIPTYGVYNTSEQTLDWSDVQSNACNLAGHYTPAPTPKTCPGCPRAGGEPPKFESTSSACRPSSRNLWLGIQNSPGQLAPDTFWQVLGSPLGLIPTYIATMYNLSVDSGPEAAWQTMLSQCADTTRTYQPSQSAVGESPWASGLQGEDPTVSTVGWTVVASTVRLDSGGRRRRRREYAVGSEYYTGMDSQSTLPGYCDMFGIPMQVYSLQDCVITTDFYGPFGSCSEQSRWTFPQSEYVKTCVNGFSLVVQTEPTPWPPPGWCLVPGQCHSEAQAPSSALFYSGMNIVQLSSFSQSGLVPANCTDTIHVMGLSYYDFDAMGNYEKHSGVVVGDRPVYKSTSALSRRNVHRFIFYDTGLQAWVVGAEVIGGPGLIITSAVKDEAVPFYPNDTPCPILGWVNANVSMPAWINTSDPFWVNYSKEWEGVSKKVTGLSNLSNGTLYLSAPFSDPYPGREQVKTCCVPWGTPPADCEHAVCDCNALYGLVSVRMISRDQYARWLGRCAHCTFYGDDDGLGEWAGGVQEETVPDGQGGTTTQYTGGCGTMTSAGPLAYVQQGNINSPVPTYVTGTGSARTDIDSSGLT